MRIVSGSFKGRIINAPKNLPVRPTTDLAKESLFNILNNNFHFNSIKVLDLFSGTGNISYEFASRGCPEVIAVDKNFHCYDFIKKTTEQLKFPITPLKMDVFSYLKNCTQKFDIIFADPPYEMPGFDRISELVFEKQLLTDDGWLIVEHSEKTDLSKQVRFLEQRNYGKVNFSIFGYTQDENK